MKKRVIVAASLMAVAFVSCVTINIYFPAEEVRNAADKIVNEVWGDRGEKAPEQGAPVPEKRSPEGSFLFRLGPETAYAVQDIDVSTPEIRAIKDAMKTRADVLVPFLNTGNVGIGMDGLLEVRTTEGLDLKSVAAAKRLVSQENDDRIQLYKEIARANGFPEQVQQVQDVFAESWRDKAAAGWYLKQADGSWEKK